jgi:hypothetical protein
MKEWWNCEIYESLHQVNIIIKCSRPQKCIMLKLNIVIMKISEY